MFLRFHTYEEGKISKKLMKGRVIFTLTSWRSVRQIVDKLSINMTRDWRAIFSNFWRIFFGSWSLINETFVRDLNIVLNYVQETQDMIQSIR